MVGLDKTHTPRPLQAPGGLFPAPLLASCPGFPPYGAIRLHGPSSLQPSICCSLHLGHSPLAHHPITQLIHNALALILDVTSYKELSLKPQDWVGVLKCGFYYNSGRMKPTDEETIATENIVCYSQFPRGGEQGHMGKHSVGSSRSQREKGENVGKNLYCASQGKEQVRQGKQA